MGDDAQPQSGLDAYMAQYGQRLQAAISGNSGQAESPAYQPPDLGMDIPRPSPQLTQDQPPDSALAPPGGSGPAQGPGQGAPPPGAPPAGHQFGVLDKGKKDAGDPNSALASDTDKQTSFRDLWNKQSADQRKEYIDKLQKNLDATNQTINTAYDQMMKQLGNRPQTNLSRQDKGMLLMEFGLHMMAHSAGENTSQAIGNAGTETMQSYKDLRQQRIGTQQKYDQMQQQLTQAHDRDVVNANSRSALEIGRDLRSAQSSDASITRMQMNQAGQDARTGSKNQASMDRTQERDQSSMDRTNVRESHMDARNAARIAATAGQAKGTIVDNDGNVQVMDKTGNFKMATDDQGNPIKAKAGSLAGAKKSAQQQSFDMYMDVYGKGPDGKPLQGDELQAAKQKALTYSGNPKAAGGEMSDADMHKAAETAASRFVSSNQTSWLGMQPEEIETKRTAFAQNVYNRLKKGQSPIPDNQGAGPAKPQSALESGIGAPPPGSAVGPGAVGPTPGAPPQSALAPNPPPAGQGAPAPAAGTPPPTAGKPLQPVPQTPVAKPGAVPTQPPPNGPTPNSAQLAALRQDPAKIAPYFLKKFGYLPQGFQRFIAAPPQSALAH